MQKKYSIAEAKTGLPSIVREVEDGPSVRLTRHGRPVAVLMSVKEYERLTDRREGFWKALTAFRSASEKEGIEISDLEFDGLRDVSQGRDGEWP
jgi:prevent-host-death family protein